MKIAHAIVLTNEMVEIVMQCLVSHDDLSAHLITIFITVTQVRNGKIVIGIIIIICRTRLSSNIPKHQSSIIINNAEVGADCTSSSIGGQQYSTCSLPNILHGGWRDKPSTIQIGRSCLLLLVEYQRSHTDAVHFPN